MARTSWSCSAQVGSEPRIFCRSLPQCYTSVGWYLIVLLERSGDLSEWYGYVGQARDLQERCHQYELFALNPRHPQLVYHIWRGRPLTPGATLKSLQREARLICLGTDESGFDNKNALDRIFGIGEMFFAIMIQCLQPKDLLYWVAPGTALVGRQHGLNMALPLHQGHQHKARRHVLSLWESKDPEVRAYASSIMRPNLALGSAASVAKGPSERSRSRRRRRGDKFYAYFQDVDLILGDPSSIHLACQGCGVRVVDTVPVFTVDNRQYVARRRRCYICRKESGKTEDDRISDPYFHPVEDPTRGWVRDCEAERRIDTANAANRQQHSDLQDPGRHNPCHRRRWR